MTMEKMTCSARVTVPVRLRRGTEAGMGDISK